jgi:hypothetical protein
MFVFPAGRLSPAVLRAEFAAAAECRSRHPSGRRQAEDQTPSNAKRARENGLSAPSSASSRSPDARAIAERDLTGKVEPGPLRQGARHARAARDSNEESAMDYVNESFESGTVSLDGNSYRDCSFRNVTFKYAGGPLEMSNCSMDRFAFQFDGDLARGLFTLYQLFGTEGMLTLLRGFTEPGEGGEVVLPVD